MSKSIKPQKGIVYECYKGFTDFNGDRCRAGQKFVYYDEYGPNSYLMDKASGRGMEIVVPKDKFASYFCPAAEQTQPKAELKLGDTVKLSPSSEYWNEDNGVNPRNIEGIITRYEDEFLGINVDWSNGESNGYSARDLELVNQGSYSDMAEAAIKSVNTMGLNAFDLNTIVITSMDQIKELAKIPFLKDQIEAQFPELFITHKVGNRYRHEDKSYYILTGENNHVALVNLETGMVESHTVRINDYNNITADEFKGLCLDTDKLQLIKERQ